MKYKKLMAIAILSILLLSGSKLRADVPDTLWTLNSGITNNVVRFLPNDNNYFINAGNTGMQLRKTLTNELVYNKNFGTVYDMDFSSTGDTLATADSLIHLWNPMTGDSLRCLKPVPPKNGNTYGYLYDSSVSSVRYTKDGKYLLAIMQAYNVAYPQYYGESITIFNAKTYDIVKVIDDGIRHDKIQISPNSDYFVSYYSHDISSSLTLWRLSDFSVDTVIENSVHILCADFSTNGKLLAYISYGGYINIKDLENKTFLKRDSSMRGSTVKFTKDNNYLVIGLVNTYIYDFKTQKNIYTYNGYGASTGLDITDNLKYIIGARSYTLNMLNGKFNTTSISDNNNELITITPNPTSNNITINLNLSVSEHININIYDLNSNLIAMIIDSFLPTGFYIYNWDTQTVSNGTYFCKVITKNSSNSYKIIVNK